jgi:nicotinamidase/pyrazinamidase
MCSTRQPVSTQRRRIMKVHLLVIDPQNDFMDITGATLPVAGAKDDMVRLASFVDRVGTKLDKIHVTLDSHHLVDIAHPAFWRDGDGNNPPALTIVTADAIADGTWTPRLPMLREYALQYARTLETAGKYQLMVWPPHCLIGSWGHNVEASLAAALDRWSQRRVRNVDFVTKGTNVLTEHYGALLAEVPIASDPTTQLNGRFLTMLQEADIIAVAGEASSHCVKATMEQVAENIGEEHMKKFRLLTDCMSPVPAIKAPDGTMIVDFPAIADQFLKDMAARGMELTTSTQFLA